jgi:hypothetical protein
MLHIARCMTLAAAAAALLAQPVLAQAHSHHGRHHHPEAAVHRRPVATILQDVASLPFYGPFGGYAEAAAASNYAGPNQRRYFGYGYEPRLGTGADRLFWAAPAGSP